ncbi:hypothetical protein CP532_4232 [Ophiocordyceps camponoti-leonardi (nom. inval.)]|nr:hypothetical protein CP532_4232 [Ophiocordyceps camponoti-leonardi (nom. inval.)]
MDYDHPDETFFETDDARPSCIDPRTAAKMVARQRQQLIADELSRTTAGEYLEDILKHTQTMEASFLMTFLIDMQREIQWYMRPYLIDFLIEAHAAFVLLPETLFLTVNLLDRYCSRRVVYKHHYQLVGCAALLIAAKYGDKKDRVPQISELSNMCCALYDGGMFSQMEMHLLDTLEWTIGHPTVDFYTHLMVTYEGHDPEMDCMASYLSEMALYHRDFVGVRPSTLARVCLTMASLVLGRRDPVDFGPDEEKAVAEALYIHMDTPSPTLARKYASTGTYRVSQRLAEFLAAREAAEAACMAQRHVDPPTPPPTDKRGDVYSTPHKGHAAAAAIAAAALDGYLTPPITPDGGCFVAPRCPMTPTPEYQQHAAGLLSQR